LEQYFTSFFPEQLSIAHFLQVLDLQATFAAGLYKDFAATTLEAVAECD
jgi:hypothetical protein